MRFGRIAKVLALLAVVGAGGLAVLLLVPPARTISSIDNPDGIHNLHLLEEDPTTGFAVYRMGFPGADDMEGLCALGVSEIAVLSGTAVEHEVALAEHCPTLEVVYNVEQDMRPLRSDFLDAFDRWVAQARASGKKIAFRCSCGCHRTGRLAAYYQMRHRGLSAKEAWDLAVARGIGMGFIDRMAGIQQQILALEDHIEGRTCRQGDACVVQAAAPEADCPEPLDGCGWRAEASTTPAREGG